MTKYRKGSLLVGIFIFVIHLVCALPAFNEHGNERDIQSIEPSELGLDPWKYEPGAKVLPH